MADTRRSEAQLEAAEEQHRFQSENLSQQTIGGGGKIESTEPTSESDHSETSSQQGTVYDPSPPRCGDGIINRVLSRVTSRSSVTPSPPPDGGLWAWLCVLGTHLVVMNTWGVINSFGAFQGYYVQTLNRPPSDISWIGSIEIFLLFFIGPFTGRLTDAGYYRPVAATGSVLVVAGTLATSACTQYWQILLAQGVCVGLGNGFLFCPTLAVLSTYFKKRRSLAIGITACGSSTGGVLFPVLVRQLLPRVGFGWTVRTVGFLQAGILAVALVCLKPRISPRKTGPVIEWAAFKEMEYTLYALGTFLCFWGAYFAFFFVATYSRDVQGMSYTNSLNLLLVINGAGTIGRLLPSHLADHIGTLTVFVPTAGAGALLMYSWIAVSSQAGLYAWAVLCGIALGGIQSMFPAALASLTTDLQKQGTRMGMVFAIVSFGVLTGPPIEGALISALDGRYVGAQAFAGTSLAMGTMFITVAREVKRRKLGGEDVGKDLREKSRDRVRDSGDNSVMH